MTDREQYTFDLTRDEANFLAVRLELIVKEFEGLAADTYLSESKRERLAQNGQFFGGLAEKIRKIAKSTRYDG